MTEAQTIVRSMWARGAADILSDVLPEVFDRFNGRGGAASGRPRRALTLCSQRRTCRAFRPCLVASGSCVTRKGRPSFALKVALLAEVLTRIEERANYGDTASGRYLADELAKEPFGWDFEVVRLLVLSLLARLKKFRLPAKVRRLIPPQESRPATRFRTTISSARPRSDRRRA